MKMIILTLIILINLLNKKMITQLKIIIKEYQKVHLKIVEMIYLKLMKLIMINHHQAVKMIKELMTFNLKKRNMI